MVAEVAAPPALDAVPTSPATKQQQAAATAAGGKQQQQAAVALEAAAAPAAPPLPATEGATPAAERDAQKTYWEQHSKVPTVEAMMLDSKAAEIDRLERPEVRLCKSVFFLERGNNAVHREAPAFARAA
jgi:hypothetical protein